MARTNANFNLSKTTKRRLGTYTDKTARSIFKNAMIDAEHSYTVNRHRKPRENTQEQRKVPE